MDQVAQVRERTDIVSLIQSYIPLKKTGNNFKANCPFHGEKTPSFVVSAERQIWHCFGCGKGGDAFSFLMEYEHIEFPEALRILAEKAGVHLIDKNFDSTTSSKKERIYRMNRQAAELYHYLLTKHPVGKKALEYITGRQIHPKTIETYLLGFAPANGRTLNEYLQKKKQYTPQDILEAGLATKRTTGIADFFANRLIFPLFDHRGNIIGFSGRILDNRTDISKYINTRETLVYHKGSVFFGLDSAKEHIKKKDQAIIMEGELDVIAAFQEGIDNAIAIKGTALTQDQVNLIARFAKKVTLCLDADSAGQEAMKRSLPLIEEKGLTTTVIEVPNGKDPDEAIKTNPIAFKQAVKHDRPIYEAILDWLLKANDPSTIQGKKQIGDAMLFYISHISNEIVKEHYLRLLSKTIDTSQEVLVKEMQRSIKKEIIKQPVVAPVVAKGREELLEEYLVSLVIQHHSSQKFLSQLRLFLDSYQWIIPAYGKILAHMAKFLAIEKQIDPKTIVSSLPQELLPTFDACFLLPLPSIKDEEQYQKEIHHTASELLRLMFKKEITRLTKAIEQTDETTQAEELAKLQQELSEKIKQLKNL